MRQHLMAGTALVAATMLAAGGALAADKKMMKPSISVNGYFDALVGGILDDSQETKTTTTPVTSSGTGTADDPWTYTDTAGGTVVMSKMSDKKDTSAADVRSDSEIQFNGRAALDNGLKVHMRVELEGQQGGGGRIDEYFLSVSGAFGQIILGGTGGAPIKMLTGLSGSWATGVGETLAYDSAAWVGSAAGNFHTIQNVRLQDHDANKVTYLSPKLGGFQVGVTYSPNEANDDNSDRINAEMERHNGLEGAVSYTGKFGDVGFGVGAAMSTYRGASEDDKKDDQSDWAVAGRIDFGGGFRVSAAHKRTTDEADADQGQVTDVGARFVTGPNSFSLVGSHGEMKDTDAQYTAVMGSYARALGPGVKWHANLIWNQSESAMSAGNNETAASYALTGDPGSEAITVTNAAAATSRYVKQSENSGMAFVTGIKVVF